MSKFTDKLDVLLDRINDGDKEAIVSALNSDIAFPAFRAIVQAGDDGLNDAAILEGIKLWEHSQIRMFGLPIQTYARATLFHLGEMPYSDLTTEEIMIARTFSSYVS